MRKFVYSLLIVICGFLKFQTVEAQILVAGTSFDPSPGNAGRTYIGVNDIIQTGLQGGTISITPEITPDADPGTFQSDSYYGITDNPYNLDQARHDDIAGSEDYSIVFSPAPGSNQTYMSYSVSNLEPNSNYRVVVNYCNPTNTLMCTGGLAYFRGIGNPDASNTGNGLESSQLQPGDCGTVTYTQASQNSRQIGADGKLTFNINSMNSQACNVISITSIEIYAIPQPEIYSVDGGEVCAGEQITLQARQKYNADYQWQVNTGSGWSDLGTNEAQIYETAGIGDYDFRLRLDYDGTIITTEELKISAITCCEIEVDGSPVAASRQTVYYDNFGRVDMSDPSGLTYYEWDYSDILNPEEVEKTTTNPFRWPLSPPPYPDLPAGTATWTPQDLGNQSTEIIDGFYTVAGVLTSYNDVTIDGQTYRGARLGWANRVTGPPDPAPAISYDHSGDISGAALFINNPINTGGKVIYRRTISDLCFGKQLFVECWIAVFTNGPAGSYNPVDVTLRLEDSNTGTFELDQNTATRQDDAGGVWVKLSANITLSAGADLIFEIINNENTDANGNDLVLDDIKVMACAPPILNMFFDLSTLSQAEDVCSDPINLEAKGSDLLNAFFGGSTNVRYLFQWTTTPSDNTTWVTYGTPQTSSTFPIPDPISDPAFTGLVDGNQVYFRVIAASSDIFSVTTDFNSNDPCRAYSISNPIEATVVCPACNKPSSVEAGTAITECDGTTGISLTGGSYVDGGNDIENATGSMQYVWYKKGGVIGGYTAVPSSGNVGAYAFTPALTLADSGMWVLRVADGTDCYMEDSVLVRVVPIPTAPTATNPNNVCVGDVAPEWKADSLAPNKLLWYTTASGGSEAETAPLINTSTEGTRNVWVSQTTATTPSCESDRTPLSITVNPNPQNLTITPGDTAYCVGTTYNLVASADASPAVTYTWYKGATPTGTTSATQTGDATTTGSPHVYSVVADSAGCTDSVSVVVTINALPTGGISIDKDSICDDGVEVATVSMTASANGPYDFYYTASVSSPTGADAQNEGSPYTGFSTSSEETIKLDSIVDVNGCKYVGINTDVVDVDYYSDVVASVATECQDVNSSLTNTQFQIRVSVTSGDLSTIDFEQISSVSGVTFTAQGSGVWLSNPISETESIDLRVFDDNGCNGGDTIADINQLCSCPSSGTLAISESTVCPGDSTDITVSYTNTVVSNVNIRLFDDNDVQIDSAINISSSPAVFRVGTLGDYKATIEHITNSCTVNGSPSVTLAHYDSLKAVIRNDADVCANGDSTSSITVEVTGNTGQGPYSYYYSVNNALNTTPETITTGNVRSFESAVLPVGTTADQVYRLDSLEDANGCKAIAQNLTGEATISPIALPEADITETGPKIQTADPTQDLNDANVLPPDYIRLWEVRKGTPAPVTLATLSTTTGTPVTVSGLEKEKIVEVILTISDDGGVCPVAKDSILIERVDETVPNAGADTSICVGNGVTRVGNSVVDAVNESVRWYKAGAPSVNLSLNETLTVAPASLTTAGSPHVYVYETTNSISSTVRTDSFAITVIAMPVAVISGYADGATITTNTLPVVLQQGAALPPDYTGAWFYENTVTIPTGGNGVGTPTNPTSISVDGLEFEESGEVTYTVSDVGGVCPDSSVTITVERKNITAACAINDTVCVSALAAGGIYSQSPCSLPVGAEQAEWLQVSGSPNPTSNADNSMSVTLAGVGTYQFTYRIFNPTIMGGSGTPIESKKTITIKVIDVPVVSSATLTGDSFGCQDTVKTYTATGILNAESYAWTLPTGFTFEGGTPSTSTTAKVVLGGTTGGDITIRATNRCGFKDTLIDVSTIYLKPTGGTVASNVSYCPSDDSVYTFRLTTAPTSVLPLTYLWDIDGGDLEGANLTSDTVQVSFENKTGPQTISLVPKNACGEPKTVSDLPNTVTATQTPAISASVDLESSLADDVTYCIDDTDDITFTATASNAGATPTYTFYQGLVEIQASSTTNTVAVPKSTIADQDVIRVEMVGTPGVCYTSSSGEDKLIMDGYKIPVVTISSDFPEICEQGAPGRIGITATVSPETSKGVNEMTIFRGASTAKFELTTLPVTMNQLTYSATQPSHTGTYTATAKNEVCPESDASAPIEVKIWEQPRIIGFVVDNDPPAPADTVAGGLVRRFMNKGTTKDIGIGGWIETKQENGNYTYLWNTDDAANKDVITNASSNPTIIRLNEQLNDDIILKITNGLCSTEREFLLQVLYPLFVPNAFSPNGDGSNDFWEISGLADFPQATVSVFNRWGNRVFDETKNYTNTNAWTGEKSPVGTYYYIIKLNRAGYPEALTGSVTITR